MRVRRTVGMALVALLIGGVSAGAARAESGPPANDNMSAATPVSELPASFATDTTKATNEPGEPSSWCGPVSNTVWWKLTLPAATDLVISTAGSNFDTVVTLYEVQGDTLQFVDCNDDANADLSSRLSTSTAAGAEYLVQIGGLFNESGQLATSFSVLEPLGNDNFADAYQLVGTSTRTEASNAGATMESGERLPCDRYLVDRTVWFRWTAPASGLLWYYASDRVVGVWTGTSLADLTSVGCDQWGWGDDIPVAAGQDIWLQVGINDLQAANGFRLYTGFEEGMINPTNDNLADAETIGAISERHAGTTRGATVETDEPLCQGGRPTIWYRYTATEDGPLVVSTAGSEIDTTVAVFNGTSYADLNELACNDEAALTSTSRASFNATAGETYLIQVGDWYGDLGGTQVEILRGVAVGDSLVRATVTSDDNEVREVAVSGGFIAGGGAAVEQEDDQRQGYACAGGIIIGLCVGGPLP